MAKAQNKTKETKASVAGFINRIKDPGKKADAKVLLKLIEEASGEKPVMWGSSIVGYGKYHYKSAAGREGDWCMAGFSPRSAAMTVYIMSGAKLYGGLLKKLGKHKISGGSCIYIKKLSDIDLSVLKKIVATSVRDMKKRYKA